MWAKVKRQWLVIGLTAALMLAFLVWLIASFMIPTPWQLSLEGKSELVSIQLAGKTQWDIGTALVCVPVQAASAENHPSGDSALCNSRSWYPLGGKPGMQGRSLTLLGALGNEIHAVIEAHHDGSVQMSLRTNDRARHLGQLGEFDGDGLSTALPSRANIIWNASPEIHARHTTILPFTGDITIGRDVSWSSEKMLLGGKLSIFAASEESLTGRTLAEEAVLLLGDQVQLKGQAENENPPVIPKGFIRFSLFPSHEQPALDVVAFAPAEGATIMRFGGGEYGFSPGWWARIKHKSALVITLAVVVAVLTILASLANILQFLPVAWEWYSKRKQRKSCGP